MSNKIITVTKRVRRKNKKETEDIQLSALPNQFPYNEMLFDGKLRLGNYRVKTRSYDPGFRGPILLYTSGRVATAAAKAHGYDPKDYIRPAIVGVADLKSVRKLDDEELDSLLIQFNNADSVNEIYERSQLIVPASYGLFFQRLRKFDKPIEFTARSGPVKRIDVPLNKVASALADNGIEVLDDKLIY